MSKLLIHENPLIVLPTLAVEIGLNEAVMVQQLHYWLENNRKDNRNFHDGRYWTYNTYEGWQKQLPFWSTKTIQRIFTNLDKQELLIKGNYNKMKMDRTNWYSVNYDKLKQIEQRSYSNDQMQSDNVSYPLGQNDQMEKDNLTSPIPETNQRLSTENIKASSNEDITHIVEYLNLKANKKYTTNKKQTITLINARLKEGYTIQDFETVIDTKVNDWINDTKFSRYLRPETLFSNKFEAYLNEAPNTYKQEEGKDAPIGELTPEEIEMLKTLNKTLI